MAADSSITDILEIALQHFDELSPQFRASFRKYFDSAMIEEEFRDLVEGMRKLRKGTRLSRDEVVAVAGNHDFLKNMATGLREAVDGEPVDQSLCEIVIRDIVPQLRHVHETLFSDSDVQLCVSIWSERVLEEEFGEDFMSGMPENPNDPTPSGP